MNFKKFTAGVLAAFMFASSVSHEELWKRPAKETTKKDSVEESSSNVEMEATNSLGNYLTQMAQTQEQESQKLVNQAIAKDEFSIIGLSFDAATGVVIAKTTQAADCTLRVSVLNDDDGKEVAVSEKALQRGRDTVTQLEFNAEAFPEYFKIQAELIGPMQDMLCTPFTLSDYTREMQEIKAADVNDFEPEYVVNLDEREDTNFVVLKEDTKMAASSETTNTLVSADYENNVFVFENADAAITELEKGDHFYIRPDAENLIAIIVDGVEIVDHQAIISGSDESIEDMFAFVKIEVDAGLTSEETITADELLKTEETESVLAETSTETSEAASAESASAESTTSMSTADTSELTYDVTETTGYVETDVTISGDTLTAAETETDRSEPVSESAIQTSENTSETQNSAKSGLSNYQLNEQSAAAKDVDYTYENGFTLELLEVVSIGVKHEVKLNFYKKWSYVNVVFTYTAEASIGFEYGFNNEDASELLSKLTKSEKDDWFRYEFKTFPIPTPVAGINLGITPSIFLEFEGKISVSVALKAQLGFIYDSETGFQNCNSSPDEAYETQVNVEGSVTIGIGVELSCNIVHEKLFSFGIRADVGCYVKGELDVTGIDYDPPKSQEVFVSDETGDEIHACMACIDGEFGLVFGVALTVECLSISTTFTAANHTIKLGDWYLSLNEDTNFDIDWGTCPRIAYKTEFTVIDTSGNAVANAEVEVDGVKMYANGNGYLLCYCMEGPHRYVIREDGTVRGQGTFNVPPGTKALTITVGNSGSSGVIERDTIKETETSYTTYRPETTATTTTDTKTALMDTIESGRLGEEVFYALHNDGFLHIYGTGDMYENCNVIKNKDKVKEVIVENFKDKIITSIGGNLFSLCSNMTSISMPDTITSIDRFAFYGCTSLESIDIPDEVTYIGEYAFNGCSKIPELIIPEKVETIDNMAFASCTKITEVIVPESVKSIGNSAFTGCSSLKKAVIASKTVEIGEAVFRDTPLEEVTLPFAGNLQRMLYGDRSDLTAVALKRVTITGGTSIPYQSFSGFVTLTEVNLPDTITSIDRFAFAGCTGLESIDIPDEVTYIGEYAFNGCSKLTELIIPEKVETIERIAFAACTKITEVIVPESVKNVGTQAFDGCTSLERIMFRGNAPVIASLAFNKVTTNAYYPKDDETWTANKLQNYGGTITWIPITPLTITAQPKNAVASAGETITFKVSAVGDDLTYKWYYKNKGTSKFLYTSSFSSNTYTAVMNDTRADRQVYCVITDKYGNSVKTDVVTMTMGNTVKIVGEPKNAVAPNGKTVKITVDATGDGLTYKWYYKNKDASGFSYTSSFSSNTYTAVMNDTRDGRQVYCVITDKYGNSVKTYTVKLIMGNPVKIVGEPKSAVAPNGGTVKFVVDATGDGLTYKWYFKNKGASKFSYTSSFSSNTYTAIMNETRADRQVYCVITDKYGNSVQTDTVTMTMGNTVKLVEQPKNAVAPNGETIKIAVDAKGDGLTYKWYFKNKGASKFSYTSSFNSNTYTAVMNDTRDGRQVYCVITDQYGNSVTTDTVTMIMGNTVKIVEQPKNVVAPNGEMISFTVYATGDGLTYKWYFKNKGASEFSYTKSFNDYFYIALMNDTRADRQVYCVITDQYGNSVKTDVVTMTMITHVEIVEQPQNAVALNGKAATATVVATGEGLTYKWYYKNKDASEFTYTSSFKSNTYTAIMNETREGRQIYCEITDNYGNRVRTDIVTLIVGNTLTVTEQPTNASAAEGASVKTQVIAAGDGLKYQWYYCEAESTTFKLSGVKGNVYSAAMTAAKNGRKVYCEITDQYGVKVKTDVVTLTMN